MRLRTTRLGVTSAGRSAMSLDRQIAALFSQGEQGAWYDPSDLNTLYQDAAGTVVGANNLPVGRIDDRSGKGNHATQATEASRPHLVDGMVLWFGSGTSLAVNFATAPGTDCTVASAVPGTGVSIQTGQTIGAGSYTISADTAGFMIFDRALSPHETSLVTRYLEMKLAILEFVEFDFSSLLLDPRIDFTRASAGTYFDADGVMQTAAINQPRIDHDPVTGAVRGLLVEEQRTNSLLNSAALATQSVTVTAAARTLSFYGTGTVTLSGASTAGPLVGTGTNDRVSLTFTPTAGTLTLTVSGSVTNAQLEAGPAPTSYIPTEGTAMTRAADVAEVNDLNSIRFNRSAGAFYCEYMAIPQFVGIAGHNKWVFSFGSASSGAGFLGVQAYGNGFTVVDATPSQPLLPGVMHRIGGAWDQASANSSVDGVVRAKVSGYDTSAFTKLCIGRLSFSAVYANGFIRRLRYYPRRLSNAELQGLTS